MSEHGYNETKEAVLFGLAIAMAADKSLSDGSIGWSDAVNLVDVFMKAPAGLKGIGEIPAELKDLDATENEALKNELKAAFDIADDKLEGIIENALAITLDVGSLLAKL